MSLPTWLTGETPPLRAMQSLLAAGAKRLRYIQKKRRDRNYRKAEAERMRQKRSDPTFRAFENSRKRELYAEQR